MPFPVRFWLAASFGLSVAAIAADIAPPFPVEIRVDAAHPGERLEPIWRFFGADEPNYATQPDGRKLLGQLGQLDPQTPTFFRAHSLLSSGDGTPALKWGSTGVYGEDGRGRPIYDWTILDRIFDTYRASGLHPYVQMGFMPEALSVHPAPYRHHWKPGDNYGDIYTGWAYPPKDYGKWEELNYQWALHCLKRYGKAEVDRWWWEVWNEPNIPYWKGTPTEYHWLYDHAVAGVRRALPQARVGGPESTGPRDAGAARFLRDFLEHCLRGTNHATGRIGTPIDFISFHAKGAPGVTNGHVRMGISAQLRDFDAGFGIVSGFPELRALPIVIGESDPDGCAACSAELYPQNAYRNGALYASYTAASFARAHALAARHQVNLAGALTWAFEFEGQPWFAGFRALATRGVELPVLNAFRLMARQHGRWLPSHSSAERDLDEIVRSGVRGGPEVGVVAARDGNTVSVLIWHYQDEDISGPDARVSMGIDGLAAQSAFRLRQFRVDHDHSNAFTEWQRLGSPTTPTSEQTRRLQRAAALAEAPAERARSDSKGRLDLHSDLPLQGLVLWIIEPAGH